jgi:hypothetical protein
MTMRLEDMAGATLSECQRYRYLLWRRWDTRGDVLWIMLNPSTADASIDDPTIRRCADFAQRWGHGGIEVVNLWALRASSPLELRQPSPNWDDNRRLYEIPDQRNDEVIAERAAQARLIVAAWGAPEAIPGKVLRSRELEVRHLVGRTLYCLEATMAGRPRHPLYVRKTATPVVWEQWR